MQLYYVFFCTGSMFLHGFYIKLWSLQQQISLCASVVVQVHFIPLFPKKISILCVPPSLYSKARYFDSYKIGYLSTAMSGEDN